MWIRHFDPKKKKDVRDFNKWASGVSAGIDGSGDCCDHWLPVDDKNKRITTDDDNCDYLQTPFGDNMFCKTVEAFNRGEKVWLKCGYDE